MKRLLGCVLTIMLVGMVFPTLAKDKKKDAEAIKEALQEVQELIGNWKASGSPQRAGDKGDWNETIEWSWRFKGDDAWMTMTIQDGKYYKSGELRFLPDDDEYQLTMTTVNDEKQVFSGEFKNGYLIFERVDPKTKETQRIMMNTAADGARFIYRYAFKPQGRTIFSQDYMVAATKEGISLGTKATKKGPECVVSGGTGTSTVSYMGKTYYVCCSGCRDEFNANPKKYVDEFEAKQKAKK
ncbi:MAG: YHS domain-containing protein [Gemmataceae bacterium]